MRSDITHHTLHPCTGPSPRPWRGRARTAGQVAEGVLGLGAREDGPRQRLHLAAAHALRQQLVHLPHLRIRAWTSCIWRMPRMRPRAGAARRIPHMRAPPRSWQHTEGLRPLWLRSKHGAPSSAGPRPAPQGRAKLAACTRGAGRPGVGAGARAWSCMTPLKSESRSMPWKEMLACSGRMPSGVFFRMSYLPISSSCPCGARQRTVACNLSSARLFSAMSTPRPPVCAQVEDLVSGLARQAHSGGHPEHIKSPAVAGAAAHLFCPWQGKART